MLDLIGWGWSKALIRDDLGQIAYGWNRTFQAVSFTRLRCSNPGPPVAASTATPTTSQPSRKGADLVLWETVDSPIDVVETLKKQCQIVANCEFYIGY